MAQGSVTVFDEFLPRANYSAAASDGTNGVCLDADSFKIALYSDAIASIPASEANPDYGSVSFTEVTAGGGYTATGEAATITVAEAGGTLTISLAADVTWTSAGAGGPADIRTAILYSTTHSGTNDAVCVIDMTTDGTAPLDLDAGDITISSGTLFTIA